MKITDLSLFDNEVFLIKSLNETIYKVKRNISVRLYIDILNVSETISQHSRESQEYADILENVTQEIIIQNHADYSKEDFDLLEAQESLFLTMYTELLEIVNNPVLKMPDIKLKQESDKYIFETDEIEVMEGITYVMSKTANSFNDIMNMPYSCYLAMLKHLRLSEYLQNEEYREAYYKEKRKEYRSKNKDIKQKVDLVGLKNFSI